MGIFSNIFRKKERKEDDRPGFFVEHFGGQKAVDNPLVRDKDPKCWECLSDEQRDTIHAWYLELMDKNEKENGKQANAITNSFYFAMIPFAVYYACSLPKEASFLNVALTFIAAMIIFCFILFLFSNAYLYDFKNADRNRTERIFATLRDAAMAIIVSIAVINRVLG